MQRVQSLNDEIARQLALHQGKLTEADLVTAMETAASADLTGRQVAPALVAETAGRTEPPGVQAMLGQLSTWLADGTLRRKAAPADTQYADAAAVAIMDELWPRLIQAVFDPLFAAGGVQGSGGTATSYTVFPMDFEDTPNGGGAHHGSAYQSGWDGFLVKILDQVQGVQPAQPFPSVVTSQLCGGGLTACPAAIDGALAGTYQALVTANGGSTDVASWTQDAATAAAGQTMPVYDDIRFASIGVVSQPASHRLAEPAHLPAGRPVPSPPVTGPQIQMLPGHPRTAGGNGPCPRRVAGAERHPACPLQPALSASPHPCATPHLSNRP